MTILKPVFPCLLMLFLMTCFLTPYVVATHQIASAQPLVVKYGRVLGDGTWRAALVIGLESLYDDKGNLYSHNQLVQLLYQIRPNITFTPSEQPVSLDKKIFQNPTFIRLFIETSDDCITLIPNRNQGENYSGPLSMVHVELIAKVIEQCPFVSELNFQGFRFDDNMIQRLVVLKMHAENRDIDIFLGYGTFKKYNQKLKDIVTQTQSRKIPITTFIKPVSPTADQITVTIPSSSSASSKSTTNNHINAIVEPLNHFFPISLSVIEEYKIPHAFSPQAVAAASTLQLPTSLDNRVDLRDIPLVTIDDNDAQDHDDAVWAEKIPEGWHIIVAIADVSYFVKLGDVLDKEAQMRGNSVYLPGIVVPMLPTKLSNDLGSLKPHVDRPCLAVEFHINHDGILTQFRFFRALMKSHGKLNYQDVEMAHKKRPTSIPASIQENVIPALYDAYSVLKKARHKRGVLELNRLEKKILFRQDNSVDKIIVRPRYDSHRMIEELMILANVAAAIFLEKHNMPTLYRVHQPPKDEHVIELKNWLKDKYLAGKKFDAMDQRSLSELLEIVFDGNYESTAGELVMKTLAQASYTPFNNGHWGLNLESYAHFTSPIRRYADLLVHRGIISILENNHHAYNYSVSYLSLIGQAVSFTDQRAGKAEREAVRRYTNQSKENNQ